MEWPDAEQYVIEWEKIMLTYTDSIIGRTCVFDNYEPMHIMFTYASET